MGALIESVLAVIGGITLLIWVINQIARRVLDPLADWYDKRR